VMHSSYGKKLMDEWKGPLLCGKHCLKHHKKSLAGVTSKTKGFHGIMIARWPKSIPCLS